MKNNNLSLFSEAIFEIWSGHNCPKDIIKDIGILDELSNDSEIISFFSNNFYKLDKKKNFIINNMSFKTIEVRNFVFVLLEAKIFKNLKKIIQLFYKKVDEYSNVLSCQIISPVKIGNDNIKKIESILKEKYKKELIILEIIDKSLISGIKIIVNDQVYDGSYLNELEKIKSNIELIEVE
jgi:F-type H+-transporting ATPase subunit delta